MGWGEYTSAVLYLLLVLGLIVLCTWLLRMFGPARLVTRGPKRLSIVEMAPIDTRRRLILVRRDQTEHLLLIGPNQDLVVETGIAVPDPTSFARQLPDNPP